MSVEDIVSSIFEGGKGIGKKIYRLRFVDAFGE